MTDQMQFNIFETTIRLRMPQSIHNDSRNKNVRTDEEEEITEVGESSASENRLRVAKSGRILQYCTKRLRYTQYRM